MPRLISALSFMCFCVLYTSSQTPIPYFTDNTIDADAASKTNANIADVPYMVSIRMKPHWWSTALRCEAAVVGEHWVLTSGRCCVKSCGTPYEPGQVCLRAASATIDPEGVEYHVDRLIVKDSYNLNSKDNNLCLIKVKQSFSFGPKLQPILLAENDHYFDGEYVKVSGWSKKDGSTSNQLVTLTLPLMNNTLCDELITASVKSDSLRTSRQLCAVTTDTELCHGEGGSPLVVGGRLAGVVTTGNGCGNKPGVYTKIIEYIDWISRYVNGISNLRLNARSSFEN